MHGITQKTSRKLGKSRLGAGAVVLCGMVLAGCSTGSGWFGSSSSPASSSPASSTASSGWGSWTSGFTGLFTSSSKPVAAAGETIPDFECPGIDIREGASTLLVNMPNADPSPLNLRYQATIGQTARECRVSGRMVTIKVGVQGRIILGPQGGPGQVHVPIRYALVRDGVPPKTLWTRLYRFEVEFPAGPPNVPFTYIAEDMMVPIPPGGEIDNYTIYVGFDPVAAAEEDKLKEKPQPKPRQKPKPKPVAQRS